MNYIKNDSGDVKVATEDGATKWLPQHLAEDKLLMTTMKLVVVPAPIPFCEELKIEEKCEEIPKLVLETPVEETIVAKPEAKKEGKTKNKK